MGESIGQPFKAELHSTDADPAVAVPIYHAGSITEYTLKDDEFLEVTGYNFVSAAGGDCYLFVGPDNSRGTGETVMEGTFAANGGMGADLEVPVVGRPGATLWLFAPAGVVDIVATGNIRRAGADTGTKETWQANDLGQSR